MKPLSTRCTGVAQHDASPGAGAYREPPIARFGKRGSLPPPPLPLTVTDSYLFPYVDMFSLFLVRCDSFLHFTFFLSPCSCFCLLFLVFLLRYVCFINNYHIPLFYFFSICVAIKICLSIVYALGCISFNNVKRTQQK